MLRTGFEVRGLDPDHAVTELGKTAPLGRIAEPKTSLMWSFSWHLTPRYMTGTLVV